MKKILFVLFLMVFVLSACGTPENSIPTTTSTPTSSPTETPIPPTATLEPSPTPMPLGGGGNFIMQINPLLASAEVSSEESAIWFSASTDGTNLERLDWQVWSISPDGKHALTYNADNVVTLKNLDGSSDIPLDESLDYYIIPRSNVGNETTLWLPSGDVVVLAREKDNRTKFSVNIVSKEGKLTKLEKPSQIIKAYATFLFATPDGEKLFWKNCANQSCKYYVTALDDSEQTQIFGKLGSVQNVYISPSGKYASYVDNSGQKLRGCFIYDIAENTSTQLLPDDGLRGQDYCFGGNHWSPIEDKLFGITPTGFSLLSVPDGEVTTFSEVNVGSCYIANWTPDGKNIFLSTCTEENTYNENGMGSMGGIDNAYFYIRDFVKSAGARLINVADGKVIEYPDAGFCNTSISPDSKWVLFYQCKDENNLATVSPQLLNLETKEMTPVLQELTSDNPDIYARNGGGVDQSWLVFWTP